MTALPMSAAANDGYETAVACTGGLQFMATMLPAGSDPAKEAEARGFAWETEALRLSKKGKSQAQADISSASDKTKTIMMSGDQAAIAEYFGPLNETCADLPNPEPEKSPTPNPFGLKEPNDLKNYNAAIMCAGKHHVGAMQEDSDELMRFTRFRSYALEIFPRVSEDKLDLEIRKALAEWIGEIAGMTDNAMSVITICKRGYDNLK